jgi:ABC-type sugar transport system substrate-binding protein
MRSLASNWRISPSRRRTVRIAGATTSAALVLALSAGVASNSASGAVTRAKVVPVGTAYDHSYPGADKKYFGLLATPKIIKGQAFKVGYLQINNVAHVLNVEQQGSAAEAKKLGGSETLLVSNNDVQLQVDQFNQFLTTPVSAIVGYPSVPGGLSAGVTAAKAKKIPVVFIGTVTNSATPLPAGSPTDVDQGIDYSTYVTMKALAGKLAKGSTFGIVGFGLPVPALQYQQQRQKYWGAKFGLKFVGENDATAGTPAAYSTAASQLLTQHPTVGVVVTLNDDAAVAAATAARVAGLSKVKVATSNGGDPELIPLIKSGEALADYVVPWKVIGEQATIAAYDKLTKQNQPLPPFIQIPGSVVTKANVNKVAFAS